MSECATYAVPFNKPGIAGNELAYMSDALARGHASGDGEYTRRCQRLLEAVLGVPTALLTPSGTHALELCALLLDVGPGDTVLLPSFTFPSTANAFVLRGAQPVFADIRDDTLNLDERVLEERIDRRTKAIVAVHYAGVGCAMDVVCDVAHRYGIVVVEDNAHGLFGTFAGRSLGTFGALAAQSFHETKNLICGEGGALLINDPQYVARAEILRDKGTDRSRYFRGEVDKYSWVDVGSSYVLSDVLAAFLYAQLEARHTIQAKRQRIWECYRTHLEGWAAQHDVQVPVVPSVCEQSYHMFYLLMRSMQDRDALIVHLQRHGMLAVFHYQPLHLSQMGRHFGARPGDCPVAEDVSGRLLRLPFYNDLTESDQTRVIEAVRAFSP